MKKKSRKDYILSNLSLLVRSSYANLLSIVLILILPYGAVLIFSSLHPDFQFKFTVTFFRAFIEPALFSICMLSIAFMYSSVLKSEYSNLWQQIRLSFGVLVEYILTLLFAAIPISAAAWIVIAILTSLKIIRQGLNAGVSILVVVFVEYIFFFSVPLLVEEGIAYLKNIKKSFSLFRMYGLKLYLVLILSVLTGALRIPESFHLINDLGSKLFLDFAFQICLIILSLLGLSYYSYETANPKNMHNKSLKPSP